MNLLCRDRGIFYSDSDVNAMHVTTLCAYAQRVLVLVRFLSRDVLCNSLEKVYRLKFRLQGDDGFQVVIRRRRLNSSLY